MRICKQFLVVTLFVLQAGVALGDNGMGVPWQTDLDKARAQAEKENKLLLIHFYSDSCGPCRVLDATVFNQPNVAGAVQTHYVPVKLNTNEFPATAERFGIARVPTDVVITPQGRMVERLTSPQTPMAYVAQMSGIAEQHRAKTARDFKVADHGNGTSVPVNPNFAKLPAAADMNSFTGQPQSGLVSNPYAQAVETAQQHTAAMNSANPSQPVTTQQPAADPVAISNPYANQPVTPMETSTTPVAGERYATAAMAPVTPLGISPTETAPTGQVAQAAPQLPPNSPPLGFFGYCPVTMKQENRWLAGDARFGCYHRGRTYLFTSAEKRDAFLANGDEFAPALSGIDPVLAIDSNKVEAGKQEFGIEYEGRFYLFSSEDNLRKFYNQPQHYATGVRQAMNAQTEGRTIR
jgi:YHS domain-containing protein/thiol-disulfide isomerase/thioredoxin